MEWEAAQALKLLINIERDISQTENIMPDSVVERAACFATTKAVFPSMEDENGGEPKTLTTSLMDMVVSATNVGEGGMNAGYSLLLALSGVQRVSSTEILPVKEMILKFLTKLGDCIVLNRDITLITLTLYDLLFRAVASSRRTPIDERYALAIRAGFFEMCLHLTASGGALDQPVMSTVEFILKGGGAIAMSYKSNKAIRKQAPTIRAKIAECLRGGKMSAVALERTHLIQSILRTAVDLTTSSLNSKLSRFTCRWCPILLPENDCKQCSKCERAFYCSRKCQLRDLKDGGHKKQCKHMVISKENTGKNGDSMSPRDIRYAKCALDNVRNADIQLFSNCAPQIMAQATLQGFQISECVTEFNFCEAPPTITVRLGSDFVKDFTNQQSEIQRNREDGELALAFLYYGGIADGVENVLLGKASYRQVPYDVLQDILSRSVLGETNGIVDSPEARERLLKELRKGG